MLDWYEPWHSSHYRQKAIDEIYEHVCADDIVSHGISIGPVCIKTLHVLPHIFHINITLQLLLQSLITLMCNWRGIIYPQMDFLRCCFETI